MTLSGYWFEPSAAHPVPDVEAEETLKRIERKRVVGAEIGHNEWLLVVEDLDNSVLKPKSSVEPAMTSAEPATSSAGMMHRDGPRFPMHDMGGPGPGPRMQGPGMPMGNNMMGNQPPWARPNHGPMNQPMPNQPMGIQQQQRREYDAPPMQYGQAHQQQRMPHPQQMPFQQQNQGVRPPFQQQGPMPFPGPQQQGPMPQQQFPPSSSQSESKVEVGLYSPILAKIHCDLNPAPNHALTGYPPNHDIFL
nr:uncharacterized protein LOC129278202 [Lytechinus pictus]